jgi:hypothetical protein
MRTNKRSRRKPTLALRLARFSRMEKNECGDYPFPVRNKNYTYYVKNELTFCDQLGNFPLHPDGTPMFEKSCLNYINGRPSSDKLHKHYT